GEHYLANVLTTSWVDTGAIAPTSNMPTSNTTGVLSTTILSIQSGTQATLAANAATTTASTTTFDYSTNEASSNMAAANAAMLQGGSVVFPPALAGYGIATSLTAKNITRWAGNAYGAAT